MIRRYLSRVVSRVKIIYQTYNFRKHNKVSIEIHSADHCNLSCYSCSHYSPIAKPKFCDLSKLRESLPKLTPFQDTIRILRVIGGEPLLNPQVCDIFELIHEHCPNVPIEITTNGILIPKMKEDFFACCRKYDIMINVTQYPVKSDLYKNIEEVLLRERVKFNLSTVEETYDKWNKIKLHETSFPVLKSKIHFLKKSQCNRMCIQLMDDKLFPCNISAHVHHLNEAFGTKFIHRKGDYLELDKIKSSKDIRKLLYKSHPFCSYHYDRFNSDRWKPSQRKKEEWTLN